MESYLFGTLLVHWQLKAHLPIQTHNQILTAYAAMQGAIVTRSDTSIQSAPWYFYAQIHSYTDGKVIKTTMGFSIMPKNTSTCSQGLNCVPPCQTKKWISILSLFCFHSESKEPQRENENWSKTTNEAPQCTIRSVFLCLVRKTFRYWCKRDNREWFQGGCTSLAITSHQDNMHGGIQTCHIEHAK